MSDSWFFREPGAFLWLLAVVVVVGAFGYGMQRRWRALTGFVAAAMLKRVAPTAGRQRWWRLGLACATLIFVVLALARPVSNPHPREVARSSRDLIFVLDVSRSMFAEDCVPNRLEAAKLSISECVANLPGQRVGLVIFAGTAAIKCPLTSDHLFFNELLSKVGPGDVSHGGTIIRDALLKSCEKLLTEERAGFQDVMLITDGGRQEESYETAVNQLNQLKARLITVGLGSDRQGVRIPSDDPASAFPYVTYDNREVRTKLETAYLQALTASVEQGVFLHVGTRTVDLANVYGKIIASDPALKEKEESLLVYDEHFRWFVGAAALLLVWMLRPAAGSHQRRPQGLAALLALGLLLPAMPTTLRAQDDLPPESAELGELPGFDEAAGLPEASDSQYLGMDPRAIYNAGNAAYRSRDFNGAVAAYQTALPDLGPQLAARCAVNLGNANYELAGKARLIDAGTALAYAQAAIAAYRRSLAAAPNEPRARINLELSVRLRAALEETLKQQQQQQQQQQEQEGDPSESGEEGESEEGEGEESADGEAEMESMAAGDADLKVDLQAEGTPPPSLDPQDVLEQERQNNSRRAQANSNRSRGKVEKDW